MAAADADNDDDDDDDDDAAADDDGDGGDVDVDVVDSLWSFAILVLDDPLWSFMTCVSMITFFWPPFVSKHPRHHGHKDLHLGYISGLSLTAKPLGWPLLEHAPGRIKASN